MRGEGKRLAAAVGLHSAALTAHLYVAQRLYDQSDALCFFASGGRLAAAWWADPVAQTGPLFRLLLQRPSGIEHGLGGSSATDTLVALAAMVQIAVGDSLLATSLVFAALGFAGKWLLYRSFREDGADGRLAWVSFLALPSAAFWTSGLLKEAVAMGLLGVVTASVLRFRMAVAPMALVALGCLLGIRPWLAGAVAVAAIALLPAARAWERWGRAAAGALVATLAAEWGARALGLQPMSHRLAWQQQAALVDSAGSAAPVVASVPDHLAGQLPHVPAAWFTAWFRPGLWEAHTALSAAAGLENLLLLVAFAAALWRAPRSWWGRREVVFALFLCGVAGVAIGLTTANLGTLVRYRALFAPLLWWVALAGALGSERRVRSPNGQSPAAKSQS